MSFFEKYDDKKIKCLLCSHYCLLKENQTGICGVNKNINSKLDTLVYGQPVALHIDPIEKKPLYHFLPYSKAFSIGTLGCNFRCPFCQNWSISQKKAENYINSEFISPEEIVKLALRYDTQSIAYTYNEPTIFYPYIKDIALLAKREGLKNIMVSNGFMSKEVINDMVGLIDALNIDLKSFDKEYYKKVLFGDLEIILENLILLKKLNFWLEITTLIIPTINDSEEELRSIAKFIAKNLGKETVWHISAFHPDYKQTDLPRTSLQTLKRAYETGKREGLLYVYIGNAGLSEQRDFTKIKHGVFK